MEVSVVMLQKCFALLKVKRRSKETLENIARLLSLCHSGSKSIAVSPSRFGGGDYKANSEFPRFTVQYAI